MDGRPARERRPAAAVVAAALAPTARVSRLGPAALTVLLGAAPLLVTLARGRAVGTTSVVALALAAGAALGWAVDDPAAETLDALPVPTTTRRMLRMLGVATVAAVVAGLGLVALIVVDELPGESFGLLPETSAAAALALAVGLVAVRRGERTPSPIAVAGGVLAVLVVAGLALRWPTIVPALGGGAVHGRWWLIVGAALVVAVRAGRDPGRP
ncbi:MAG: hypothetical protein ACRDOT_09490 [Aeromicrobium sp.]